MLWNEGSWWSNLFDLLILLDIFVIPTIEDFLIQRANVCPRNNPSSRKYRLLSFCNTRSKLILLVWSGIIVSGCLWIDLLCWILLNTLARRCQTRLHSICTTKRLLSHSSNGIRSCLKGLAGWLWGGDLSLNSIWIIIRCCHSGGFYCVWLLKGRYCLFLAFFVFLFIVENLTVYILILF